MTALIRSGVGQAVPRVNWGRWVVECDMCHSALKVQPDVVAFECWECNKPYEIIWPSLEKIFAIARLLSMRPDAATRNWEGESLHQLTAENAAHGLFEGAAETLGVAQGVSMFSVTDDHIRADLLPTLETSMLREIGA